MGCGKSKTATATTEPIKKPNSRTSSRKREDLDSDTDPDPVQDKPKKTVTTTTSSVTTVKKKDPEAIVEGDKKNGENPVGVIPGEPFVYQKTPVEKTNAVKTDVVLKEERKKMVVVVGHDRTASKESQVSDYFSDGNEEKSEYDSPQPDEVVVVQEQKKIENENEEGATKSENDREQTPKQVQVQEGAMMAAEDKRGQDRIDEMVVEAVKNAMEGDPTMADTEITVEQETKTVETDEVQTPKLRIKTKAVEQVKKNDS